MIDSVAQKPPRDELREKIEYALERCARYGYRSVGVGLTADDARRILDLLAPQEARAERDELRGRLATTLAALVALRDVVRDSGKLNGMEYDELGVQVNRAIAKAEAALLAGAEVDLNYD